MGAMYWPAKPQGGKVQLVGPQNRRSLAAMVQRIGPQETGHMVQSIGPQSTSQRHGVVYWSANGLSTMVQ